MRKLHRDTAPLNTARLSWNPGYCKDCSWHLLSRTFFMALEILLIFIRSLPSLSAWKENLWKVALFSFSSFRLRQVTFTLAQAQPLTPILTMTLTPTYCKQFGRNPKATFVSLHFHEYLKITTTVTDPWFLSCQTDAWWSNWTLHFLHGKGKTGIEKYFPGKWKHHCVFLRICQNIYPGESLLWLSIWECVVNAVRVLIPSAFTFKASLLLQPKSSPQ